MKKVLLSLLIIIGLGVHAQTDVYFNIEHFLGSTPFSFNSTATNSINQEFQVTRLQYYIAEIKLIHDGGTETTIPNLWILVDASSNVNQLLGNFNITDLESIEFGIGVESGFNHLDPASYPVVHPLGPKSPSMHWGWASGYRFLAMEGKSGTNMNLTYEIHALGDGNYQYVTLATTGVKNGSEININIDADYEMALKGISVSSGPISHGETGISALALNNFNTDVFAVSTTGPNGIEDMASAAISLYPNPSNGIINMSLESNVSGKIEVLVMDVRGQIIIRKEVQNTKNAFVSIPNNGLYLVNVVVDGQSVSQERVIIYK